MRLALEDAGIEAQALDYINAHATATPQGDIAEVQAISRLVGDSVPVSSFKGHLGHTLAASGALELGASVAMMQSGEIAATRNLDAVDPACGGVQHLQHNLQRHPTYILKNNFAMGGINSTVIIRSCAHD